MTGGGTREPIDAVRYVGNASTGRMALEIARVASRRGHRVTLFLAESARAGSASSDSRPRSPRIRVEPFVSSAELARALRRRRGGRAPDAIVHAAAVSDYAPIAVRGKIRSGRSRLTLEMRPLPKIAPELRRRFPRAILVIFKLETAVGRDELARRALRAARKSRADLVFANLLEEVGREHRGTLHDVESGAGLPASSRGEAARRIVATCEDYVDARRQRR